MPAQDAPNIHHMGPTWLNVGLRCAPDSLILLHRQTLARERQRERERERKREREGGRTLQDGSPDFGVYSIYARAVSLLREKDATGTPEVPVPVLHREGLFGPPPTEDVDDVHLARTNSQTLLSARTVRSSGENELTDTPRVQRSLSGPFFGCYGLVVVVKLAA